jgi:hypothetical protein
MQDRFATTDPELNPMKMHLAESRPIDDSIKKKQFPLSVLVRRLPQDLMARGTISFSLALSTGNESRLMESSGSETLTNAAD